MCIYNEIILGLWKFTIILSLRNLYSRWIMYLVISSCLYISYLKKLYRLKHFKSHQLFTATLVPFNVVVAKTVSYIYYSINFVLFLPFSLFNTFFTAFHPVSFYFSTVSSLPLFLRGNIVLRFLVVLLLLLVALLVIIAKHQEDMITSSVC